MATFDDVAGFVREWAGFRAPVTEATSLQSDIGLYGDDMDGFLAAYARRFGVDVTGYLWYFHTGEEGWSIGGLFFSPPNALVKEIPVTVGMLYDFAQKGRWAVEYPEHTHPRSRPDILVNQILVAAYIVILFVIAVRGCAS